MPESQPVALVTGSSRGIGLETARQLGKRGFRVIMTGRDEAVGRQAESQLRSEGLAVDFRALDVANDSSVKVLADWVKDEVGRLDVLVNNAGVFLDPSGEASSTLTTPVSTVQKTFETNVYGPMRMVQALVPLLEASRGRIVNVSSGMGQLSDMDGYQPAYKLSKTALNALTLILADELADKGVKVNAVCPGWVRTDMGGPSAPRTPQQGADTVVWAATLPEDGPTGGFFRDRQPIPW